MKNLNTILMVGAITAACGLAEAGVIAGWDFNGVTGYGVSPFTVTESDVNSTIGGLTRGSGFGTTGTAASNAWGGTSVAARATLTDAVNASQTILFTVAAKTGYTLNLSSIGAYNVRRSSTGAASGQWQYSINGGTFTNIGSTLSFSGTTSSGNSMSAIDLSAISALQGIASGSTVSVRLVAYANSGAGTFYFLNTVTGSDLTINGTLTAVPAPGAAALVGLAGLITTRRRK